MMINKLLNIPGPKELGLNSSNALPIKSFNKNNDVDWDDYDDLIKMRYPIRLFIEKSLIKLKKRIWNPVKEFSYYLKSHLHPKYRYHVLDLRQPALNEDEHDYYRYGWADISDRMMYAMFNLLEQYVKTEMNHVIYNYEFDEIINDPILKNQFLFQNEAQFLLEWWQQDRKQQLELLDCLLTRWNNLNIKNVDQVLINEAFEDYVKLEDKIEKETEEMLIRLVKIRNALWS